VIDYYKMTDECRAAWNLYKEDPDNFNKLSLSMTQFCAGWNAAMAHKKPKKQKSTEVQLSLDL